MNRMKPYLMTLAMVVLFATFLFQLSIALDFDFTREWRRTAENLGKVLWILAAVVVYKYVDFNSMPAWFFWLLPVVSVFAFCSIIGTENLRYATFVLWSNVVLPVVFLVALIRRTFRHSQYAEMKSFFLRAIPSFEEYKNRANP